MNASRPTRIGVSLFSVIMLTCISMTAQVASVPPVSPGAALSSVGGGGPLVRTEGAMHIGDGDLLEITVFQSPDLSSKTRVDNDGDIVLPLTGKLHVAGLTAAETALAIRKSLMDRRYVKDPLVTVSVAEYATAGVSVLGEVKKPGIYVPMGSHRLDDYLSLAEGLTQYASSRISVTHRSAPDSPEMISYNSTAGPHPGANPVIMPGDTINVLRAGEIYVVGDVVKPGGFLLDHDEHLTIIQALALAQGANHTASLKHSMIIRKTAEGHSQVAIDLDKVLSLRSKDVPLQDNDILFVPRSKAKAAANRTLDAIVQTAVSTASFRTF